MSFVASESCLFIYLSEDDEPEPVDRRQVVDEGSSGANGSAGIQEEDSDNDELYFAPPPPMEKVVIHFIPLYLLC